MVAARENPLVTPEWLEARLGGPAVRVMEVSAEETPVNYDAGHIPGAAWFFWKDLCWDDATREFLTPAQMSSRLGAIGIDQNTTVVIVGDPVQYGTYAYWALRMAGHPDLRVLDGGRIRWADDGRPLTSESGSWPAATYDPPSPDQSTRVSREDVLARLGDDSRLLLDVRSPEEYRGERVMPPPDFDHGAERKGRIPGARPLYYRELLNDDDTFKTPQQIREALAEAGIDPATFDDVVAYCRLSHRATLVWTALHHLLGYDNVRIYDGSWTEWGSMVGMPIET